MADEIISRAEARARGLSKYFTGKLCKSGHVAARRVSNGVCVVCQVAIEARWRDNNRDVFRAKVKRQAARHRLEKPERIKRNQQRYAHAHRDQETSRKKQWREDNPEKASAAGKRYYGRHREIKIEKHRKWRDSNRHSEDYKKIAIDRLNRWIAENPDKRREIARKGSHTRRARQYEAGGSYTSAEINALLEKQNWRCAEVTCRADLREGKELDHYIPVSKGGRNDIGNLQWLCVPCNRQKRDMMPDEWAKHRQQQREKGKIS